MCYFAMYLHRASLLLFLFLVIRRPPRSTLDRSSAASDVYKRQQPQVAGLVFLVVGVGEEHRGESVECDDAVRLRIGDRRAVRRLPPVSYTHLRAHRTVLRPILRPLLEKKKQAPSATLQSATKVTISDINSTMTTP